MSNKEIPDIGDMYEFYQLKGEILDNLKQSHEDAITDQDVIDFMMWTAKLIIKIESIGKKEKE